MPTFYPLVALPTNFKGIGLSSKRMVTLNEMSVLFCFTAIVRFLKVHIEKEQNYA